MSEPTTALDDRFSDAGATPTSWDDTMRMLETAELFWITTVRGDGRPHVSPLVAVWLDGAIHFSTGASEQKAVNLRSNSHVTMTTGCNQWDRGPRCRPQGRRCTGHRRQSATAARRRLANEVGPCSLRRVAVLSSRGGAPRSFSQSHPPRSSRSAKARLPTPATVLIA